MCVSMQQHTFRGRSRHEFACALVPEQAQLQHPASGTVAVEGQACDAPSDGDLSHAQHGYLAHDQNGNDEYLRAYAMH